MGTPESRVKRKISAILKKHGENVYYFMPVQTGKGKRTLDYLICAYGYFVAVEAKAPGKHLTLKQIEIDNNIATAGGRVRVIDSTNLHRLESLLDHLRIKSQQEATRPARGGFSIISAR